jgi:mucin-19
MRLALSNVRGGTLSRLARHMSAGGAALALCAPLWAGPEGERVVSGTASFDRQGATTQITAGNNAMIQYSSFDIASHETVRFIQPDAQSRVFNQVFSADPTTIAGRLEANGIVYIMNSSGVYFRQGALVNVGEIYAGAGHISQADFLNGIDHFQGTGTVVNEGTINAAKAVLVGTTVINAGTINTPNGVTILASGEDVLIGEYGGRIFARISGANAAAPGTGVDQRGTINAAGGRSILSAGDMYADAIWHRGTTRAADVTVQGGSSSRVRIEGTIDASNTAAGASGGRVDITGGQVRVENATVRADGDLAGGQLRVGGDYLGQGDLATADGTVVDRSTLSADAANGDGGRVIVWSDGVTGVARSSISAQGGATGEGGFVETSGKQFLDIRGVDVQTTGGAGNGLWLLDPSNVEIIAGGADSIPGAGATYNPTADSSSVDVGSLATALQNGNNVTITTNRAPTVPGPLGTITLSSALNVNFGANAGRTPTLTLLAADTITFNANVTVTSDVGVSDSFVNLLLSGNDPLGSETATPSGAGGVTINNAITTLGGSVTLQVGATSTGLAVLSSGASINTLRNGAINGGAVNILTTAFNAGGAQISGTISTSGGAVNIGSNSLTGIIQVQTGGAISAGAGGISINSQQVQVAAALTTTNNDITVGRASSTLVQMQSGGTVSTGGANFEIRANNASTVQVNDTVNTSGGNVTIGGRTISSSVAGTITTGAGTVSIGNDGNANNITIGGNITTTNAAVNILTSGSSAVVNLNSAIRTGGAAVNVGSATNTSALTLAGTGSIGDSGDRVGAVTILGGALTFNGGIFAGNVPVAITAATTLGLSSAIATNGGSVTFTMLAAAPFTLNGTGSITTNGGDVVIGQLTNSTGAFNLNSGSTINTASLTLGNGSVTVRSGALTVSNSISTNGANVVLAPNGTATLTLNSTASILTSGGNLQLGNGTGTEGPTTINAGATLGTSGNRLGQTEIYGSVIQLLTSTFVGNSNVTIGNSAATAITVSGAINTASGVINILPAGSASITINSPLTTTGNSTAGAAINIGNLASNFGISINSGATITAGTGAVSVLANRNNNATTLTIAESVSGFSFTAEGFGINLQLGPGKSITTGGNQTYTYSSVVANSATGGLLLSLNALLQSTANGTITFNRNNAGVIRGGTRHLTIDAGSGGTVAFNTPVGTAGATLGQLSVTADTINLAGSTLTQNSGSATGVQLYTGNVVLSGSGQQLSATVAAAGTTAIDVTGLVNAVAAGTQTLAVNSNGVTRFQSAIGTNAALGSFTTDAGGTTQLGGDLFAGTVTIGDALELLNTITIFSTLNNVANNNGAIGFQTINSGAGGPFGLTVNTGGVTTFAGAVGGTGTLNQLVTDVGGSSVFGGGTYTFAPSTLVNIQDPASLTANTTFSAGSTASPSTTTINFGNTLNGGGFSLSLNAPGTGGRVQTNAALTNLSSFSSAAGEFGSFRSITTTGAQTFTDAETRLNGTYTISTAADFGVTNAARIDGTTTVNNTGGGQILFFSTVDSNAGGPFGLTVNSTGLTSFQGVVGGGTALASLESQAAGTLELRRSVTTTGNQTYADGTISLGSAGNDITLSTTSNGSIDFSNAGGAITLLSNLTANLNGSGVGTFAGTITGTSFGVTALSAAGGGVVFSNAAADAVNVRDFTTGNNGTVSLRNVTVAAQSSAFILLNGTGTKTLNGTYNAGGTFTVEGPVTLGGTTVVNLTAAGGARNAAFVGTVDGAFALTVNTPGTTDFQGLVGSLTPLTGLTTDNPGSTVAIGAVVNGNIALSGSGGVSLSGTYNTAGAPNGTFNATGPVSLTGNTTVTTGSGDITFSNTVNGAFALTANTTGATNFQGTVGSLPGTRLASLTTNAGGTVNFSGDVRTTGNQLYNDAATITGGGDLTFDTSAGGSTITFNSTLSTTGTPTGAIVSAIGGSTLVGQVTVTGFSSGGAGTLSLGNVTATTGSINLNNSGATTFNGTYSATNGQFSVTGPVTLGGATTVAANSVDFLSTINGTFSLGVTATTTDFRGAIGGTDRLASLTVTSAQTNFHGAGASGASVRTTGNQSYSGAVTVIGPTAATNFDHTFSANGGGATITFGGILGAGNENDTQAVVIDGGLPTFNGFAAGPAAPFRLRNVTFASTLTITADTVFDFGVTPVTFAAITGSGGGTPHDLTINTSGLTILGGAFTNIDNFTAGGGGTTCIETDLTIAGNFTFGSLGTPENLCIGGPVPGAITLTYLGMDVFGTTFSAASPAGPRNLTLNSGAALTRFRGSLGVGAADQRLADVTSNNTGSFRADSGSNLTGTLTVNDATTADLAGTFNLTGMTVAGQVTLNGATTLDSGNGTINWSNAGDVTGNSVAFTVNNTGTATFAGRILSVGTFTSDEGGTINLNAANSVAGNLTIRDDTVNLSGNYGAGNNNIIIGRSTDATLTQVNIAGTVQLATTNAGEIAIAANVANTGANAILRVDGGVTASTSIGGDVTGLQSIRFLGQSASARSITVDGTGAGNTISFEATGASTISGTYTTNGDNFRVTGATIVGGNSSVSVGAGTAIFLGAVDSTTGGPVDLAVDSTNAAGITFGSTIGATDRLRDLTTTGAGGQTTLTGNVSVTRAVSIGHALRLAANTTINSNDEADVGDLNPTSANITITGAINADAAANNRTLEISTPDNVAIGAVGTSQALAGLSVLASGDLTFNGNVATRGGQTYNVIGTTIFTTTASSFTTDNNGAGGDFQINNPNGQTRLETSLVVTTGAGGALFNNPVNADSAANNRSLTITAGGITTIGAAFGATQALESLTVAGGGDTILNGSVTTNADQTFDDRIFVSGSPTLTVNSNTLNPNATINFNFATRPLNGNSTTPSTLTTQNGIVRFGATTNILFDTNLFARVNFSGSTVEITGDTTFTFSVGNTATQFDLGPVTGTGAGTPHNLIINSSAGLVRLTGALTQIDNLTTDFGGTTRIEADLSVAGDLTFNDPVELPGSGGINRTLTANDITFASVVNGFTQDGLNLIVNSTGGGSTQFQGLVGGNAGDFTSARLNSVTTNADGTVSSVGINAGSSINFNESGAGTVTTLSGAYSAFSFSVSDDAGLAGATTITTTGGALTFNGALAGGNVALTLNNPAAATTIAGAATDLLSFQTDATGTQGGTLSLNGVATNNGDIILRDTTITLAGDYSITAGGSFFVFRQSSQVGSTFGTITALNIANGTTTITSPSLAFFGATINGVGTAGNLVVSAVGNTTFGASIGAGANRLQTLTTTGGGAGITVFTNLLTGASAGTAIQTSGNQTYVDPVVFNDLAAAAAPGPDYTLSANGVGAQILFNDTLGASAANRVGLVIAAGTPSFSGSVSTPFAFRQITFSGELFLLADTTYDFGATPVSFNLVTGTGAGIPHDFTVNTSGLTRLTGAFTNIDNFTSGGGGITCIETNLTIAGNFTLGSLGTPEDLCLGGPVPGVIILTYAGLDVFGQTFSAASPLGARDLFLSGSAATRFRGLLGRAGGNDGVATLTSSAGGSFRADAGGNIATATLNDGTVNLAGTFAVGSLSAPNAVVLTGDTVVNATATGGTTLLFGTVDGGSDFTTTAPNAGLASNSQFGVIGGATPLATVSITGRTLNLNGSVTTIGSQSYTTQNAILAGSNYTVTGGIGTISFSTVNLAANTVTLQTGGGNISVPGSIEADDAANTRNVVINTSGQFSAGSIGTNRAVTSVTSDAGGTSNLGSITTTGGGTGIRLFDATVTLNGNYNTTGANFAVGDAGVDANVSNALLAGNTTINAGAGTIFFEGTVDSSDSTSRSLTATASGLTTFQGSLGVTNRLSSLLINGGGNTTFGLASGGDISVLVNGDNGAGNEEILILDAVTLARSVTFNAGSGLDSDMRFGSTINADAAANNRSLTLITRGSATVVGAIGAAEAINIFSSQVGVVATYADITTRNTMDFQGNAGAGSIVLNGNYANTVSANAINVNRPLRLAGNSTFSNVATGQINFNFAVDATTAGAQSLTVNTTGLTIFGGNVGSTTPLASLTTDLGGTVTNNLGTTRFNNGVNVTTTGNQIFNDRVIIGTADATAATSIFTTNAGSFVQFLSNDTANSLGVGGNNGVALQGGGLDGSNNGVKSLTINGGAFQIGGGRLGGSNNPTDVTNQNFELANLTLNGGLHLIADTTLGLGAGNLTVGTVTATAGPWNLAVNTTGNTFWQGAMGATVVNNFTTDAGGETCIEADLTIAGTFTFNDAVCIGGPVGTTRSLTTTTINQNIFFNNLLYSAAGGPRGLSLNTQAGGQKRFADNVGRLAADGDRALGSLTTNNLGNTRLGNGSAISIFTTTTAGGTPTTGNITFNDAVQVVFNTTINASSGNVLFNANVNSTDANFVIATNGNVTFVGTAGDLGFPFNQLQVHGTGGVGTSAGDVAFGNVVTSGSFFSRANVITLNGTSYVVNGLGTSPLFNLIANAITFSQANTSINNTGAFTQFGGPVIGNTNLNVTSTGSILFQSTVGAGGNALASLTANSTAGQVAITSDVTTTGLQSYTAAGNYLIGDDDATIETVTLSTTNSTVTFAAGPILDLGDNLTISAGTGNVSIFTPIENLTANLYNLTINSAGVTTLAGAVGDSSPLATVTTDALGSLVIATSVATNGAQTYNDATVTIGVNPGGPVQLSTFDPGGNVSFTSAGPSGVVLLDTLSINSAAGVSFGGPVNGGFGLSATSAGGNSITFSAAVGGIDRLQSISLTAGGTNADINLRNVSTTGTQTYNNIGGTPGFTRLNGSLDNTSNGPINFNGGVRLLADSTVSSTGGAPISFNNTIDGNTAGGQSLGVNTSGDTNFRANIGGANRLSSLTTDAGGTTFVGPTAGSAGTSIRTTGNITFNDASQFLDVAGAAAPGPDYTLDANGVGALVRFNGSTGASAANRVGLIIAGGSPSFTANNSTPFAFRAVTIQSALNLTANTVFNFGSAAVTLNTVNGNAFDLTIDTSGLTTLNGPFNDLNNYTSLGGGMTCIEADLSIAGIMTFGTTLTPEDVCIGGPAGGTIFLASSGFLFTGDVSSKTGGLARSLNTNAGGGATDFAGTIGGSASLDNLTITNSSLVNLRSNGSILGNLLVDSDVTATELGSAGAPITITSSDGDITFNQQVALLGDTTLGADLNINFNNVLNGPGGLTVSNSNVITFTSSVGSGTSLAFLTVNANTINARYDITTSGGNITLNSNAFGGDSGSATYLGNNDGLVTITSNGGTISTTGRIVLSDSVTFSAGAGSITFGAGSAIDADDSSTPRVLTLNSTGAVDATENIGVNTRLHGVVSDAGGTSSFRSIRTLNPDVGGTGITLLDNTVTLNGTYSTNTDYNSYTDVALGAAFRVGPNGGPNTAVILFGDTTVTTGDAAITFNSTIDEGFALTLNSTGTTTLNGVLGIATRLASLTTDAGGTTDIFTNSISTTGAVTFGDALRMGSLLIINTNGTGAVTFNNTINTHPSLGTAQTLSVDNATVITVNGQIGDTSPLGQVILNGTSVVLNPHVTPGATGIINVTTVFDVPESPTLLARDLIITGGTGYVGFGGSLDSAPGTPRNLTINAPGAGSEVYFNWAAGPGIGTINPLQTLTVNNAGTIYLGFSPDYTGPVAINLVGGPAVVEGQLTTPPVALFLDGNVLLGGDTSINAGNGRVLFTGTINSQTATARSLSIITSATRAAPVEFARPLPTEANRLALFNAYRSAIIFGNSIGNTNALNNLFVGYDGGANDGRPTVPAFATILFANQFDNTGLVQSGPAGVNFNTNFTVDASRVTFGFNEKVTAFGTLDITAARADLGDITATNTIRVDAPDIRVRSRINALAAPYTNTQTVIFGFSSSNTPTEGTDEGTSFVAGNAIEFTSSPVSRAQNFVDASTNPDPQFATSDGQNITVPTAFRTRSYFSGAGGQTQFIAEFLTRPLNVAPTDPNTNVQGVIHFSRRAQGTTNQNVSETITPIIIVEIPQLNPPSTLGQALADQLEEIGLFVRRELDPESLIDFLVGRSLYNDRPLSTATDGNVLGSAPDSRAGLTSPGRLSLDQVNALLERTNLLRAREAEFRDGLNEVYASFMDGRDSFDAAAFRDVILGLDPNAPARQAFVALADIYARVEQLGLGPNEVRAVKKAIIGLLGVEAPDNLAEAVESIKQPAEPVGQPQAALNP